jgi:hypothetical protein
MYIVGIMENSAIGGKCGRLFSDFGQESHAGQRDYLPERLIR